jgi:mono/diheme cytochrome c family protein
MRRLTILTLSLLLGAALPDSNARAEADEDTIDRGRYLVAISGCNDCHTPSFPEKAGRVPESEWLIGSAIGFRGPWGTTYAANLRVVAERYTADEFVTRARSELLPPMPWFNLLAMTDEDLKAVYSFIRSLGPVGDPVPAYVPPGMPVTTPYYVFVPQADEAEVLAKQF